MKANNAAVASKNSEPVLMTRRPQSALNGCRNQELLPQILADPLPIVLEALRTHATADSLGGRPPRCCVVDDIGLISPCSRSLAASGGNEPGQSSIRQSNNQSELCNLQSAMLAVFYISGHGLGHASRAIELVGALTTRHRELRVLIRTSAPSWAFDAVRGPRVDVHPLVTDPGVVQHDSLRIDEDETVRRAAGFYGEKP